MNGKHFQNNYFTTNPPNDERSKIRKTLSGDLGNLFDMEELKKEVTFWNQVFYYFKEKTIISKKEVPFLPICVSCLTPWTFCVCNSLIGIQLHSLTILNNVTQRPLCHYVKERQSLCLVKPKEQKLLIKFRETGLRHLKGYLNYSNRREFQLQDLKLLIWSTLSLVSFFYSKNQNESEECKCLRKHKLYESKLVFRSGMYLILPEKQNEVIRYSIRYMTFTGQWNTEEYDTYIFQELLTMITKPELLVAKIIKQIELSQKENEIQEALNISCTLASILEHSYWDKYLFNHVLHNCFNTLLKVFLLCRSYNESLYNLDNVKLRMTIKTCIKNFISNIKDNKGLVSVMDLEAKCLKDETIANEDRLEITDMIAFCAQQHHTKFLRESIPPDLLNLLLKDIQSLNKSLVFSSHKIFHYLLDRHENLKYFIEPVYYFKGRSDFSVNLNFSSEDVHFFKSFSKNFFSGIYHCLITFTDRHSLIISYVTLCLVLVEIPEPVITINVIHALIRVQNQTLKSNLPLTTSSQIHAVIAALLSLICLIHQNEVVFLKRYVEEVVRFRAEYSPHLLPPLQNRYDITTHQTTTYYAQLYFKEQEVLYALQKCWLGKRNNSTK